MDNQDKLLELHTNLIQIVNNIDKVDDNIRCQLVDQLELLSKENKDELSKLGRTSFDQIVVLLTK